MISLYTVEDNRPPFTLTGSANSKKKKPMLEFIKRVVVMSATCKLTVRPVGCFHVTNLSSASTRVIMCHLLSFTRTISAVNESMIHDMHFLPCICFLINPVQMGLTLLKGC